MTTAVIVQARMTSSRLPGKAMLALGDSTVLGQVLRRSRQISGVDHVVCAIPEGEAHDPLIAEASRHGAIATRGPESDVLMRYLIAAQKTGADVVMRVTSDCPLIDPLLCERVLTPVLAGDADYAANNLTGGWAHGHDCEAFTFAALERASIEASTPYEREHVTPWLRNAPNIRRVDIPGPGEALERYRLTIDYLEDLTCIRAIYDECATQSGPASIEELHGLLEAKPEILALNAMHHAKANRPPIADPTLL